MNSASNMIAKWYQNAWPPPPNACAEDLRDADGERRGAAGAGDQGVLLDRRGGRAEGLRRWCRSPSPLTNAAADSAVPPVAPAGLFIAK